MTAAEVQGWLLILALGAVTVALRALPLLVRRTVLDRPLVRRLNQQLPLCVMVVLTVNALSPPEVNPHHFLAELGALAVVAASYLLWRNALLSVAAGLGALMAFGSVL
jgi:branched-subunit amino acid transport protein AzlD